MIPQTLLKTAAMPRERMIEIVSFEHQRRKARADCQTIPVTPGLHETGQVQVLAAAPGQTEGPSRTERQGWGPGKGPSSGKCEGEPIQLIEEPDKNVRIEVAWFTGPGQMDRSPV